MAEEKLLKVWANWEDGVGYLRDTGETNGMYNSSSILGLSSELRPAPFFNTVTVDIPSSYQFQYYFEEPLSAEPSVSTGNTLTGSGTDEVTLTNHTITSGTSNRILIVLTSTSGQTIPTVTYGGVSLTNFLSLGTGGNEITCSIFYLLNPDEGTANVVIDVSGASIAIVALSIDYYDVDQSTPFGNSDSVSGTGTSATRTLETATGEVLLDSVCVEGSENLTAGADQLTNDFDITAGAGDNSIAGGESDQAGADGGEMSWSWSGSQAYVYVAAALLPADRTSSGSYLYAINGRRVSGSSVKVKKISLKSGDFGNLETGEHDLTPLEIPGQPARYLGKWFIPAGNDQKPFELTTIGDNAVSNDTLSATASSFVSGMDHLANLNFQLIGSVQDGTNDGGIRILAKNVTPLTNANWGSVFEVGDRNERAGGMRSLGGAVFIINPEGIFSFNASGKSGLIFEDFRVWKSSFVNIPMQPWNGGLVIPHPSGLLFYTLGRRPISIGIDSKTSLFMIPPSGSTELHGGRHHGTHPVGDFLYAIHQPDISSTTVNIMCGYSLTGNPLDIIWQILGTTTLQDNDHMLGLFVSLQSRPLSASYITPTLWFGNGNDLNYIVLDTRGSPFRSRADTHKVVTSGDAYMSELVFETPTRLTKVVVHTKDMASGDQWTIKGIADNGSDSTYGKTIVEDGRAVRRIDRHDVHRFMLHIKWEATSSSDRVPPTITRIELWGVID